MVDGRSVGFVMRDAVTKNKKNNVMLRCVLCQVKCTVGYTVGLQRLTRMHAEPRISYLKSKYDACSGATVTNSCANRKHRTSTINY